MNLPAAPDLRQEGPPERVLVVHNYYQQRGGEDAVVASEVALLRERGHAVETYTRHNDDLAGMPRFAAARDTLWSSRTARELDALLEAYRPQVIHVHNTFPLISASLYWAAARRGVPVVQTLHNFRLFCAQAMFLRQGAVCEDCLGRLPWRAVARRCYRDSTAQSAVLASNQVLHRALGTYRKHVARYIALNEFCRAKFIQGGLPAERMVVKPNFVDLPAPPSGARRGGLFVGRLSVEKGVATLAAAAAALPGQTIDVVGTGPLEPEVKAAANLRWLGWMDAAAVYEHMRAAAFLVLPSIWYENFPRTIVEAFACGLPVVAARIGALAELVEDGVTGLLFNPGDAQDLARQLQWACSNPARIIDMGRAARSRYEALYTPDQNYLQLRTIYRQAIASVQK